MSVSVTGCKNRSGASVLLHCIMRPWPICCPVQLHGCSLYFVPCLECMLIDAISMIALACQRVGHACSLVVASWAVIRAPHVISIRDLSHVWTQDYMQLAYLLTFSCQPRTRRQQQQSSHHPALGVCTVTVATCHCCHHRSCKPGVKLSISRVQLPPCMPLPVQWLSRRWPCQLMAPPPLARL